MDDAVIFSFIMAWCVAICARAGKGLGKVLLCGVLCVLVLYSAYLHLQLQMMLVDYLAPRIVRSVLLEGRFGSLDVTLTSEYTIFVRFVCFATWMIAIACFALWNILVSTITVLDALNYRHRPWSCRLVAMVCWHASPVMELVQRLVLMVMWCVRSLWQWLGQWYIHGLNHIGRNGSPNTPIQYYYESFMFVCLAFRLTLHGLLWLSLLVWPSGLLDFGVRERRLMVFLNHVIRIVAWSSFDREVMNLYYQNILTSMAKKILQEERHQATERIQRWLAQDEACVLGRDLGWLTGSYLDTEVILDYHKMQCGEQVLYLSTNLVESLS